MIKNIIFLIFILFANGTLAQSKIATINIKASIYCDHCKKCPSCGKKLENAVYNVKGVKRIDINEADKTLTVIYNSQKTNPETIKKAITKVGFDADDMTADPEAYTKLDDCCKKPE